MENKLRYDTTFFLQRFALLLFVLFPVALSILAQTARAVQTWGVIQFLLFGFLAATFLLPVFAIYTKDSFQAFLERSKYLPVFWVVGLAVVLRIVLVQLISTDFVSDMEDIHLFAMDVYSGNPTANLQVYPNIPDTTYLTMTGLVLSMIYKIFGASTAVAKLSLVVLAGLSTWLIFLAGKEISGFQAGLAASFLYATLPSLICFSGVLTGDHFALPLMVLAVVIYSRLDKIDQSKYFHLVGGYALCGAILGFVDWFRAVGLLLLIALTVSILLFQLIKRRVYILALALIALFFSYFLVSNVAVWITESMFEIKPLSISRSIGGEVLVGLNPETNGGVTLEDKKLSGETYIHYGSDNIGANRYLIGFALDRLRQADILYFLRAKFSLIWASHDALFDYALNGSNDQEFVNLLRDFETLLYLAITIFILVNAISSIRGNSNPATFSMQLFILGFALLMLVFEVQNRYVIAVIPFSILLGAMGMKDVFSVGSRAIES